MSAWRSGAWRVGAWREGSWRGMMSGAGIALRYFGRISRAKVKRIAKLNYTVTPLGGGLYNKVEYSGISSDIVSSISYEGWEEI